LRIECMARHRGASRNVHYEIFASIGLHQGTTTQDGARLDFACGSACGRAKIDDGVT
jgi:hypothetical protein